MRTIALTPLFKGDAPAPTGNGAQEVRRRNETLMTGIDPFTGAELIQKDAEGEKYGQQYLDLLEAARAANRPLAENIGRVVAASLRAILIDESEEDTKREEWAKERGQLMFVEGCEWDWGLKTRTGAETNLTIFKGIVPEPVQKRLLTPIVDSHSRRTYEELRKVFDLCSHIPVSPRIEAVTHDYHQSRALQIAEALRSRLAPAMQPCIVHTPLEIASQFQHRTMLRGHKEGWERFLIDLVRTTQPTRAVMQKEEEWNESVLTLLAHVRQKTLGMIDPEAWMLPLKQGRRKKPVTSKRPFRSLRILDLD